MRTEGIVTVLLKKDAQEKMVLKSPDGTSAAYLVGVRLPDSLKNESLQVLRDIPRAIRSELLHAYAKRGSDGLQLAMLKELDYLAVIDKDDGITVAYRIGRHASSGVVLKKMAENETIRALENEDGANVDLVLRGRLLKDAAFNKALSKEARDKADCVRKRANCDRI